MTVELSTEKYPVLSKVISLIRDLQYTLENVATGNSVKQNAIEIIDKRLGILMQYKAVAKSIQGLKKPDLGY